MKTAISVPEQVFRKAERFARRTGKSRSRLYAEALAEYLARHTPDEIEKALERVCLDVGNQAEPFVATAARRILQRSEW